MAAAFDDVDVAGKLGEVVGGEDVPGGSVDGCFCCGAERRERVPVCSAGFPPLVKIGMKVTEVLAYSVFDSSTSVV